MHWEVRVPRASVNDDFVELVDWCVADGAYVEEGSLLCVIETSKASLEISAERGGFVSVLAAPGQRVMVREAVCLLHDSLAELEAYKQKPVADGEECFEASRKAVELAERLGVDLTEIGKRGVIRERDVQEFNAASAGVFAQPPEQLPRGEDTGTPSTRDARSRKKARRVIRRIARPTLHAAMWVLSRVPVLSSLVETLVRAYSIGLAGSTLRCAYYRNKLMHLGKKVRIDTGAIFVLPAAIEIGDSSHIDCSAMIVGGAGGRSVRIGKRVHIGAGTVIHGTGGVTIGDRSVVAAGSCVYSARNLPEDPNRPGQLISMSHAASPDDRYIVRDPVVIEDYVFIGLNVSILPGVTVGRGSIVNSGAVIARDVPAYSIVGGPKSSVVAHRQLEESEIRDIF